MVVYTVHGSTLITCKALISNNQTCDTSKSVHRKWETTLNTFVKQLTIKLLAISIVSSTLVSCASTPIKTSLIDSVFLQDIVIEDEFRLVNITADNITQHMINCVPMIKNTTAAKESTGKYKEYLSNLKRGTISVVTNSHSFSAKTFIYTGNKGTCIAESEHGFPIFPDSAILKTIDPNGVSNTVAQDWRKTIALNIATKGTTTVAYKFQNGNALIAKYWVENGSPIELLYSNEFKAKGTWEKTKLDNTFSDTALKSTSTTKYNSRERKIPAFIHLLTPTRPLKNSPRLAV